MDSFFHDLRYAAKLLIRERGFTVTAVLTLGLVLGANAAIFSVVHSVLLDPLPYPGSERLVTIYNSYPHAGAPRGGASVPNYFDRREGTDAFEELALYRFPDRAIELGGRPERVRTLESTPSLFRLLGVQPASGRLFTEAEGEIGNERKVLLSDALAQELCAADCLGKELRIDARPYEVVGVMPPGFHFLDPEVKMWTSRAFTEDERKWDRRHSNNFTMVARLRPGVTVAQAQSQIDALNASILATSPLREPLLNAGFQTVVVSLQEDLVRDVKGTLYLLWAGVACVLLIGCVNVVNLVLVRSNVRLKELSTRVALGAGRRRIAAQLLTESILLTLAGAVLGLAGGYGGLRSIAALGMEEIPRGFEIAIEPTVVAYTLGLALVLGVVLGVLPLWSVFQADMNAVLREEGRGGTSGHGARGLRRVLVTAQVAFAFLLLIGAGLLLVSFRKVLAVDPGFRTRDVLTATVSLPESRYPDDAARRGFAERALAELRALPGVEAAGATDNLPFGGSYNDSVIVAEGYVMAPGESLISPSQNAVTAGYFEAMGIPLKTGRFFDERDTAESLPVMLVDARLAKRFWGDSDPLGKRLFFPNNAEDVTRPDGDTVFFTVVGVVGEVKSRGLVDGGEPPGAYYLPNAQAPRRNLSFVVRTATVPGTLYGSLRSVLAKLDPELPLFDTRTMAERLDASLVDRRTPMLLVTGFGAAALFLAAVGLYGVLAYLVTRRTREIGIRMALGSNRPGIFRLIMNEGFLILGTGLVLGGAGVFALRGVVASLLYGVGALDPWVLAAVGVVLILVSLLACMVPALRATRVHPVVALHE